MCPKPLSWISISTVMLTICRYSFTHHHSMNFDWYEISLKPMCTSTEQNKNYLCKLVWFSNVILFTLQLATHLIHKRLSNLFTPIEPSQVPRGTCKHTYKLTVKTKLKSGWLQSDQNNTTQQVKIFVNSNANAQKLSLQYKHIKKTEKKIVLPSSPTASNIAFRHCQYKSKI